MKLYYHPLSQHSRRVRVVCHELGLEPSLECVALEKGEHLSEAFRALTPAHAIPVLQEGDFVLSESNAIMRYLCDSRGGDRLFPRDLRHRATVEQWLDWTHCKLNPPIQTVLIHTLFLGAKADAALVAKSRQQAADALQILEEGLKTARGIGEGEPRLSDVAAATTVALHVLCKGELEATPRVAAWYQAMERLPSFAATRWQP